MTALTAKTTMNSTVNYTDMSKKGLWMRFKNYLAENQQIIIAGMAMMNGYSNYACSRLLNKYG